MTLNLACLELRWWRELQLEEIAGDNNRLNSENSAIRGFLERNEVVSCVGSSWHPCPFRSSMALHGGTYLYGSRFVIRP